MRSGKPDLLDSWDPSFITNEIFGWHRLVPTDVFRTKFNSTLVECQGVADIAHTFMNSCCPRSLLSYKTDRRDSVCPYSSEYSEEAFVCNNQKYLPNAQKVHSGIECHPSLETFGFLWVSLTIQVNLVGAGTGMNINQLVNEV